MRYNNGKSVTQRTEKFFHDCVIDSAAHCIAIKTMELNSYLGGWAALCGEITDCVRLLLTKLISIVLSQIQGLLSSWSAVVCHTCRQKSAKENYMFITKADWNTWKSIMYFEFQ